eukprot:gene2520-2559_t
MLQRYAPWKTRFGSNLALQQRLGHKPEVKFDSALPIDDVLPALSAALATSTRAVLVAPPGAGKTTRVPLALLDAAWQSGKILMLEPRRLAARAAAERMAGSLGERIGQTIGLRVRMETLVSAVTRIEIVTEGVFTRMILDDPALVGVSAVIFDEFHERSLDADLGLALALDAQAGLREDLRILVMSATLDGARVASLLDDAPVLQSEGRAFPVTTIYKGYEPQVRLEEQVAKTVLAALQEQDGSILVFMPGQGEIIRLANLLNERIRDSSIDVVPLYGALDRATQTRAIAPPDAGRRKIVIATSIAETSVTIDGVRVVVDSGFARVPRYEPDLGLTRLETRRLSRASADQRRGRAGRTQPGVCYRLWEEAGNGALEPFTQPEILSADLSGLLLDLASWGATPEQLNWLDIPPKPALKEAKALLQDISALDEAGRLTEVGAKIRALALPPRLASMVIRAGQQGEAPLAAEIAMLTSERGLGGDSVDLVQRLERFYREKGPRADEARRMAKNWARQAGVAQKRSDIHDAGRILALAFPDRIAKARGKPGEFLMVNGRAVFVDPAETLARAPFLAIGEIIGRASASRVLLAAPISLDEIFAQTPPQNIDEISFDLASKALRARRVSRLGALVFKDQPLPLQPNDETALRLAEGIGKLGLEVLPWSKAALQLCHRVEFLRRAEGPGKEEASMWPDLSQEYLRNTLVDWLSPHLSTKTSVSQIGADDVFAAISGLLPWDMQKRLEQEAPTHFTAPTGSHVALDYETEGGPVLAIRVQELFGLSEHPSIARGKLPLTLHLLSPAHRPIQITRDLPGFWKGSWAAVKSEMKGRYPRHVCPDDPAGALPTARAKPRGT